jgi:hypothetical protein
MIVRPPPNKRLDIAIASVPFCNPHSIDIAIACLCPDANRLANKKANPIMITLSVRVINPASAKYSKIFDRS